MEDVYVVETFQYDWKDRKVISQYLIVNSMKSGQKLLKEAVKEYEGMDNEVKLILDDDNNHVYMINDKGVETLTGDNTFFIGCTKRHVNTLMDVDEMLDNARNTNNH